jgi:iron complex outermembrane recepter protein
MRDYYTNKLWSGLLLSITILFFASGYILAQGTISGKVTDTNGDGIPGVNVILENTTIGAASNVDGAYKIENVPAGDYVIKFSAVGFKSQEFSITVSSSQTTKKDVTLKEDVLQMEGVVVTGTAGGSGIQKKDASFSITTISPRAMEQLAPPSTAAALDLVPGVWSESSGGVAGANIFVRGLPSSGDAPFVTMSINGAPIYGTETLSFLEQSSIFRIDETVATTEALRGGPSSVFSNGEAGLTTNFNLKKGTDQTLGLVKYTTTDYSQQRFDAVLSGPLGQKFYYMVGGYYRTSPGIRNTQFNSEQGAQVTAQLTKVFDKGVINGFARLTDDHGQWILPMALSIGNNEGTFSPLGNATRFYTVRINAQGDSAQYDFSDGRGWKGIVSGLNFNYGLGSGWTVRDNLSYTSGDANTFGLVPNGSPMSVSSVLNSTGLSSLHTAGGSTLTSGYVQSYGHWVVLKQIKSVTNDVSLTNEIGEHKITIGAFQSYWTSQDFWSLGNTELIQAVANGDVISNIPPDAGSFNLNESGDARMSALYAGDSWQLTDALRLDIGARYDFFNLNYSLDGAGAGLPDGKTDQIAHLDGNDWAGTAAFNYQFTDNVGVFIRGSKGALFPTFDDVRSNVYNLKSGTEYKDSTGTIVTSVDGTVDPNLFNQFEAGLKVDQPLYSLFITGFLNTVQQFDGDVLASRASVLLKTRTFGVEIDGGLSVDAFKLNLVATFQSGKITESAKDPAVVGHKIWRQPDFQFRISPSYDFPLGNSVNGSVYGAFRYVGKRWDDRDNAFQLDAFTKLDLGVNVATNSGITFNLSGDNLADSHGLTEGDPRDPSSSNGRPILGRSIKFAIGVNF